MGRRKEISYLPVRDHCENVAHRVFLDHSKTRINIGDCLVDEGESNDTRLLILRNLLRIYERKNRTTRCMPTSYVQNHVQRNRSLRRCSSTQVLRRLRKTL